MTANTGVLFDRELNGLYLIYKKRGIIVEKTALKTIADNRKARHDYFVLESYEAGIELTGTEVKSIREGGLNLKDSWISIDDGEAYIKQMHISPYEKGNIFNKDPLRTRKLLMHKREIMKLLGQVKQDGLTLIPISVYFKGSRVKVQVGLCKGKKLHDKRDAMAQRDAKRTIDRELKMRNR
jgi:SsrA-binding protein